MKYITIVLLLMSVMLKAQVAITIPTEFEKNDKLVLAWAYNNTLDSIISEVAGIVQQVAEVEIIYNPDSTQYDTTQIISFLTNIGVDAEGISFLEIRSNTCWLKQYSPVMGYGVFDTTLIQYLGDPYFTAYNQPNNDSIPKKLSELWGKELASYNLEFENTNLQYDGFKNLFIGSNVIEQNIPMDENEVRTNLNAYFASDDVIFTPYLTHSGGGDIIGNNMYMKMLDFETILVASIPDTLPDFNLIEDFVTNLETITNKFGGNYNVIRIPSPPNSNGSYPIERFDESRSYTDAIIVNNIVLVPSFGISEFDTAAYQTFKKYMDGYQVYMVDSRSLTMLGGSLGSLALVVPQSNLLRIIHEKNIGAQEFRSDYDILCLATSSDLIEEMWLYYRINDDTEYTKKEIYLVCPQHFGVIEGLTPQDTVHYYIEAISSTTTTTYPLSAPNGNFTFWFDIVNIYTFETNTTQYSIVPNPSSGDFKIYGSIGTEKIHLSIYNMSGTKLFDEYTNVGETISLGKSLKEGYYTVLIVSGDTTERLKLLIVR